MKVLSRLLLSLLMISMTDLVIAAKHSSESDVNKVRFYRNVADVNFVREHAVIPRKENVMIIDARSVVGEYDKGHIPGAYSIPFGDFDKLVSLLPTDKSALLIYYCESDNCILSHQSAYKAEQLGYTNIRVYSKGFKDWWENGNIVAVTISHLKQLIDDSAPMMLVDSRPKSYLYDKGHIPGAISIPDRIFDKMVSFLPKDKATSLYFYCEGYKCKLSSNSAVKAKELGYTNVYVVPEGYPGWKKLMQVDTPSNTSH